MNQLLLLAWRYKWYLPLGVVLCGLLLLFTYGLRIGKPAPIADDQLTLLQVSKAVRDYVFDHDKLPDTLSQTSETVHESGMMRFEAAGILYRAKADEFLVTTIPAVYSKFNSQHFQFPAGTFKRPMNTIIGRRNGARVEIEYTGIMKE